MKLSYVLYASRLTVHFDRDTQNDILSTSRRNNARDGLTGFLHIEAPSVLQLLEGPESKLRATMTRISADPRHEDVRELARGQFDQRYFDGWSIALVDYTTFSLADLADIRKGQLDDLTTFDPLDLISVLSANASFLRMQPAAG